jgi:colanic acid/amylovoran biosynthesis protein
MLRADSIILCGGGYLYSSKRRIDLTLVHNTMTILAATIFGKQAMMMPQSIGPLNKKFDRVLIRRTLGRLSKIVPRDHHSLDVLKLLRIDEDKVVQCPDIAFYGWGRRNIESHHPKSIGMAPKIGLSLMDWRWSDRGSEMAFTAYIEMLTEFICAQMTRGRKVVLCGTSTIEVQDQNDYAIVDEIVRRVTATAGVTPDVIHPESPEEFFDDINDLNVFIGTRLHSSIIALLGGTPALALAYQPKTEGTYALLGLDDWCIDIRDVTTEVLEDRIECILSDQEAAESRVYQTVERARQTIIDTYFPRSA